MGHLDRTVFERDTLKRIAESGCYMEWDLFGWGGSYYAKNLNIDMPSDDQRLERIAWISSEGYGRKVVSGAGHMHEGPSGEVRRPRLLVHTGPHSPKDAVQGLHSRGCPRHPGLQPRRSAHVPVVPRGAFCSLTQGGKHGHTPFFKTA